MKSFVIRSLAGLFLTLACFGSQSFAQSGSQSFTVQVPTSLSITAPQNAATLTHDETDSPQAFASQAWSVLGNVRGGVIVTFTAAQPFTNVADSNFKRNAELNLALGPTQGPAVWTIGTSSAATDYATNKAAVVTASSNGAGRANLGLTVKFITESYGIFPAGEYVTTVTGTIAAK